MACGGHCDRKGRGREAPVNKVYRRDEVARFAQQEEDRLAWIESLEIRFKILEQKLNRIEALTRANQLQNQTLNSLPKNPLPVEEENNSDFNSFIDWNSPPIYDDYPEDLCHNDELVEGNNTEKHKIDFIQESEVVGSYSSPNFDEDFGLCVVEELEYRIEELECCDFLGIEQIISSSYANSILIYYFGVIVMKVRLVCLVWRRNEAPKYSKYLIRWSGGLQYLCNEDPMNSRTNFLQIGENDGDQKMVLEDLLFLFIQFSDLFNIGFYFLSLSEF